MESAKDLFTSWQSTFEDRLNTKVEKTAILKLDTELSAKIQDTVGSMCTHLADKNDTKKALKLFDKQIKNLYELMIA